MGGELVERQLGVRLGYDRTRLGWSPDPASDVGEDVLELLLGPLAVPSLLGSTERQVAALAVCTEPERECPAPLAVQLEDLSAQLACHRPIEPMRAVNSSRHP